jgi:nitrogen fixation NifU-like protein
MNEELYQAAILALAKRGTGAGRLEAPTVSVTVDNPLCGDRITLDLTLDGERVRGIGHKTRGCVLCQAAATVIAEQAPGKTRAHLATLPDAVTRALREEPGSLADLCPDLGAFAPVHRHKSRHDCVLLPFEALRRALEQV